MAKEETRRREIWEVLDNVSKAETKTDQVATLRKYDTIPLRQILQMAYDPNLQWLLPRSAPPFTSSDDYNHPTTFHREYKRMGRFFKGMGFDDLANVKRESQFIQILEGIHPKDAEILVALLDNSFTTKYPVISEDLVREAFPNLLPAKVQETPKKKRGRPRKDQAKTG